MALDLPSERSWDGVKPTPLVRGGEKAELNLWWIRAKPAHLAKERWLSLDRSTLRGAPGMGAKPTHFVRRWGPFWDGAKPTPLACEGEEAELNPIGMERNRLPSRKGEKVELNSMRGSGKADALLREG